MANKIVLKKSSVAAKVPLATDLEVGEIAVNLEDQKLYSKKADGTVILVGNSTLGDVIGSGASTDNAITRYDGTTGKLIQNSTVTLNDNGTLANVNAISLDTTPTTPPTTAGTVYWDAGNGTPSVVLSADTELQLGQENIAKVYNGSGATIPNGAVVAVVGAQGQRPSIALADADSESTSANTLGIATESIANGAEGFVCTFGLVRGLDTSGFTAGDAIYLSQTAGQFTHTRPSAPAHTVTLGWVIKVNASSGEIFVNISNGWELNELHNVLISSPTGGNLLAYDQTNQYWKNINLTDGTGISVTETTGGAITVTNTAPDQVVSITGAGTSVVTGTYPNFTITSNDEFDGTVTSVGGTGTVNGITLTGTVTSSGNLTLGGTLSGISLTTQVTGTLPVENGGTGLTSPGASGNVLTSNGSGWISAPSPGGGIDVYSYDNRNSLRTLVGNTDEFVYVDTIGLLRWVAGGTSIDDDETCFQSTGGQWISSAAHADLVNAHYYNQYEPVLFETPNTILSVAAGATATQTISLPGAIQGAPVAVGFNFTMPDRSGVSASVTLPGIITLRLFSVAGTGILPISNWSLAVFSN